MDASPETPRYRVQETRKSAGRDAFARAVRLGLRAPNKHLPCQFIYDAAGSALFEEICALDSYYPPEAERAILERHAAEIVAGCESPCDLVELGSGSAEKTERLLAALRARQGEVRYVPIDVSRSALDESARRMLGDFDDLTIHALVGDYDSALDALPERGPARLFLWLGSSIGNLDRAAAAQFLSRLPLRPVDRLFVGIDLRKDRRTLELAYAEPEGVTARFIKNVLVRINRELGGDFDLDAFDYRARYDEDAGYVSMDLVSTRDQTVTVEGLELEACFGTGEAIHVESSYKYSAEEIDRLAAQSGLSVQRRWFDPGVRFCDVLLRPG